MKATNSKEHDAFSENAKKANRWFNDATESMLDIYRKQLNTVADYYGNIFNTYIAGSKRMWNPYNNLFFNSAEHGNRINPFGIQGNDFSDLYLNTIEKSFRQMNDYSQNIIDTISGQIENENTDWNSLNQKYREQFSDSVQSVKKILGSLFEASNKQLEFTAQSNQRLLENINEQLDFMMRQNEQFWSDVLNNSNPKKNTKPFSEDGEKQPSKKREKVEDHE